jgi:hypothetical protein
MRGIFSGALVDYHRRSRRAAEKAADLTGKKFAALPEDQRDELQRSAYEYFAGPGTYESTAAPKKEPGKAAPKPVHKRAAEALSELP